MMLESLYALLDFYIPLIAGLLVGKALSPPREATGFLSRVVLHIFMTALLFDAVYSRSTGRGLGKLFTLTLFAATLVLILLPITRIAFKETELVMTSIYANAGYLPIPLAYSLWGKEAVALVGFYVLGSTTTSNIIIPILSSGKGLKEGIARLLRFTPLYSLLLALTLALLGIRIPYFLQNTISKIGSAATTLALVVLGLETARIRTIDRDGIRVFLFRQTLVPLLAYLLATYVMGLQRLYLKVVILEAPMPPAVTNVILAYEYGLDSGKVANVVITSTLLSSLITIVVLMAVLG